MLVAAIGTATLLTAAGTSAAPVPDLHPSIATASLDSLPPGLREGAHDVVINGVRLWYRVAGTAPADAPPVVFLHGGPGQGSQSFAALAGPQLEPSLRMVYLDQRGSGRSERPWNHAYSIAILVEDIEGLRRELGVPRIDIVAQSFGGVLALEYAAKYPDRVRKMVIAAGLSDTPASLRGQCALLARTDPAAHARALAAGSEGGCDPFQAYDGPAQGEFVARNMFPDTVVQHRLEAADTAGGLRNTGELGGAIFSQGLMQWRFAAHERLTMPVLVIAGERDLQIGLEPQRDLARLLPDAQLLIYEGAGHFMYLDAPERFARDVTAFLRG